MGVDTNLPRKCDLCDKPSVLTIMYGTGLPQAHRCEDHRDVPARDPKKIYCPHCGAAISGIEVAGPTLAELGSPLQPAGEVVFVSFTCTECRTVIGFSVVSSKAPGR
jgi:hypothetical protein